MKKFKEFVSRHKSIAGNLACLALVFTAVAANSPCFCIYHEVEKPDLTKLRKF